MSLRTIAAAAALGLMLASPARTIAAEMDRVAIGYTQTATDIGLYIADKRGYFKEAGIDFQLVLFDSAARMVAPVAGGDLQAVAGSPSAAFFNAVARGIDIRMVADKVSTPPGRASQTLIVRKDLFDTGRVRTVADLKGMKIANGAPGTAANVTLGRMMQGGGLKLDEIEQVYLAFPQMVVALANKAVDAALPAEPATTEAIRRGLATKLLGDDVAYPNHEIAVIFFTGKFATEKPDVAKRFLKAFLRGVRDHNDALGPDGKFTGEKGEAVIRILNEYTPIKDPQFYRDFALAACDPDGTLNVDSVAGDLAAFKEQKLIEGEVDMKKVVDLSFLKAALAELGPYKRAP